MFRLARSPLFFSIIFLIAGVASAQIQQRDNRPRTASISGRITISDKPAANAKVSIKEVKNVNASGNQASPIELPGAASGAGEDHDVLTDNDGRYRLTGLPEGKYEARAVLGNCVREQASPNKSLTESVSLDEGESRQNVDFALVRGGVITGRVTDSNGRPLIGRVITVQMIDEQGRKDNARNFQNFSIFDMFQTDDRGVYRIFALHAGRYLVNTGADSTMAVITGAGGDYPRTWHPDVTDENQAKVIAVTAGAEVTGVDIRLGVAKKSYEALGRVVDDETGKPIAGANVICAKVHSSTESIDSQGFGISGGNPKTDEQGNFHLRGLTPGTYHLSLADLTSFMTGGSMSHYSDGARFEIQGADVAGIEIRAKRGATISGVAVIEDANPSAKASLSQTMLMAHSMPSPQAPNEPDENTFASSMTPASSRIGSDGSFSIKGLRPGKQMIQAFSMPGGSLKIVRIERDGAEMSDGIVISGREDVSGVRIVFGKGSGVIRGQVNVTGGELPKGWRMIVMAHNKKDEGDLNFGGAGGTAEVDAKGRFVIEGLLPGEYELTLSAFPEINPGSPPAGPIPPPVSQKAVVTNGQEAQVTMTLDLKKKDQEEK